ncbi:hypothetical protein LMG31886_03820 [Xanthomonas hydrangeae]|nr:hypothetical protein LMG31887_03830 [Xanthomonas hydrangeae]CAD7718579.1 hypothetical protein LMG31887_03830 [Xanthomonas hydrangeae]CAD7722359.1 hypothetical protein LMG31886_03820 [Xanthomonas hydrangeae]CAD7722363.1 hypothetical protein LMG31886_03820 [Xanthomonas hydrangeae]CAD7727933.1 hypothetical protein LMG31885_11670 [Xanthomonas hydrangeae]
MRRPTSRPTSARKRATELPPTEIGWHSLDPSIKPRPYVERTPIPQPRTEPRPHAPATRVPRTTAPSATATTPPATNASPRCACAAAGWNNWASPSAANSTSDYAKAS